MNKNKKPYILKLNKLEVKNKYKELGTIKAVAAYYNASRSTMERFFRRQNIPYIKVHKNNFNEKFFGEDNELSFYLAGFIAADGNIGHKKCCLSIGLSEKDKSFLKKVAKLINFKGKLHRQLVFNNKRNSNWKDTVNYVLKCSSKTIINDLKKFNIVPRKTKIYKMPEWLLIHPLVHHFMRGYFDGDGHVGIRNIKKKIGFTKKLRFSICGNLNFIEQYQQILEKKCQLKNNKINQKKATLYAIEYCGNIVVGKIFKYLYNNSTFCLNRKKDKFLNVINKENEIE